MLTVRIGLSTLRQASWPEVDVSEPLWIALGFVAAVVVYVVATVIRHDRKSREQWRRVDKSKLKDWDDED